jgi:hypothetical protein
MPHIIYSLRIQYAHDGPGKREIIAHLTQYGMNRLKSGVRPRPSKTRIVDLRVGDEMLVEGQWRRVLAISTFFERNVSDEEAARHAADSAADGWLTSTQSPSVRQ